RRVAVGRVYRGQRRLSAPLIGPRRTVPFSETLGPPVGYHRRSWLLFPPFANSGVVRHALGSACGDEPRLLRDRSFNGAGRESARPAPTGSRGGRGNRGGRQSPPAGGDGDRAGTAQAGSTAWPGQGFSRLDELPPVLP